MRGGMADQGIGQPSTGATGRAEHDRDATTNQPRHAEVKPSSTEGEQCEGGPRSCRRERGDKLELVVVPDVDRAKRFDEAPEWRWTSTTSPVKISGWCS
jgi:hypothetical protein